ncbi:MAG: NADH-ubiquinone oxidoreductase-F iron-sulfur binding region domain-containing protein [Desulfatiglans sp.]|jgi:NADH-quinone oxidoreductase subunit F|nr:NADH-ubiquinone oxidoreductase-F iron-sulfur binding region domain-containing protein [Thermodesulfobacteriota bacterium]MEE4354422.1 NADH-ubiquinone oxidoreductase-F iron-sulfur binding region domain-containing protein [Desulfatiglans sp.]
MSRINSAEELKSIRNEILSNRDPKRPCITLCTGTACQATGAGEVYDAFEKELKERDLEKAIDLKGTGCHGFCEKGPIVVIYPDGICYVRVQPGDVSEIISQTLEKSVIIDRLLYTDPTTGEKIVYESDIPFYKHQNRLIFGDNRRIDPKNIQDYLALGGYEALAKAICRMTPDQVLEEVKKAHVRGRGGGGFPTGIKWESCRNAPGDIKYVIVNCDEGDPGAYMDRSIMEGNPHLVLEGLIIGAYAIGANEGFVYVRQEYPLAVKNLAVALTQAEEFGFLGDNILGSGFNFTVKVHRGAGAFISGESSALMAAIEGNLGRPRPKYIHTVESGIWGRPSNLNNVETWANIPVVIKKGAEWYRGIGTEGSKGTKIFALVGKVNNTGLVEVPMGMTLRDIIFKIGGGIPGGKKFKAVQTGGPSGGCLPEEYLDTPVDFDELTKLGSMMGSGGMIVMDEDTCMVDVAKYFLNFLGDESCGQCYPCREGLRQLIKILGDITEGKGRESDIELLEDICTLMKDGSLCALGKTAANPVLSTIRYFRNEYDEHIKNHRCTAGVCKELIAYYIHAETCRACMICFKACPVEAISGWLRTIHRIDQEKCTKCGTCLDFCPPIYDAVSRVPSEEIPPLPPLGLQVKRLKGKK